MPSHRCYDKGRLLCWQRSSIHRFILSVVTFGAVANAPAATLDELLTQARQAGDEKRFDAAIEISTQAIAVAATSAMAHYERGYAYAMKQMPEEAIGDFSEAIRLDPSMWKAYRNRALSHCHKKNYDQAIADLAEAIRLRPDDFELMAFRATCYLQKGDYSQAIRDCDEVIQANPAIVQIYGVRAHVRFAMKRDLTDVLADLDKALQPGLGDKMLLCFRGDIHCKKGDFGQALRDYDEVIRMDRYCVDAHYGRAIAFGSLKNFLQALDAVNIAIRIDPSLPKLFVARAEINARTGQDLTKILNDLDEALRLNPQDGWSWCMRGEAFALKHDFGQAFHDYDEAIRLAPDQFNAYAGKAAIYDKLGDDAKATADLERAIQRKPDNPDLYEFRGGLRIRRGDYDGITDLKTADRLRPANADASFETWARKPLDDAALRHGEEQVRQMLRDRPAMAQFGEEGIAFYRWAASKFAGEDRGERLLWDPGTPVPPLGDSVGAPRLALPGRIQIDAVYTDGPYSGKARSSEELWSSAVAKLYHIANEAECIRLNGDATNGTVSLDDYVNQVIQYEQRVAARTRAFYIHVFLPWAKDHRVSSNPTLWYTGFLHLDQALQSNRRNCEQQYGVCRGLRKETDFTVPGTLDK